MDNKKVIGIYHKNCIDGTTAAAVLLRKFPDIKLFSLSHPFNESDLLSAFDAAVPGSEVYFVDYALGVEKFLSNDRKVFVIDHHIGLKDELDELAKKYESLTYVFDNDKSGASLAWSYFFPDEETPELIRYVEDADLWRWKYSDDTKYVTNYLSTNADTPEQTLELIKNGDVEDIKEKGKIIADYSDVQISRFIEGAESIDLKIGGLIVPAYNLTSSEYSSVIGNKLSTLNDRATTMFSIKRDSVKFNFRGKDGQSPTALEIAKLLGGGGHENSSGAEIPLKDFIKMIIQ